MAYLSTNRAEYSVAKQTVHSLSGGAADLGQFSIEQFIHKLATARVGYLHLSHWVATAVNLPVRPRRSSKKDSLQQGSDASPSAPTQETTSSEHSGSELFQFVGVFDAKREGEGASFSPLRAYLTRNKGWLHHQQACLVRVSASASTEPLQRCQKALEEHGLESLAFWSVPGELCFVVRNHAADQCVAVCFEALWNLES